MGFPLLRLIWNPFLAMHVRILSCHQHPNTSLTTHTSRYKCWKVTGIFPWAALIFVAGYSLREVGAFHFGNLNVYIASLVMLYAAPYAIPPSLPHPNTQVTRLTNLTVPSTN